MSAADKPDTAVGALQEADTELGVQLFVLGSNASERKRKEEGMMWSDKGSISPTGAVD